jgi:hypothetical protein
MSISPASRGVRPAAHVHGDVVRSLQRHCRVGADAELRHTLGQRVLAPRCRLLGEFASGSARIV